MNTEYGGGPVQPIEYEIGDRVFKRYPLDETTVDDGRSGVAPEIKLGSMEGIPIEFKGMRIALHHGGIRIKNDGGETQDFIIDLGVIPSYKQVGWEYYTVNRKGERIEVSNMPPEGAPKQSVSSSNLAESRRIVVKNGKEEKIFDVTVSRNDTKTPSENDTFSIEISYKK